MYNTYNKRGEEEDEDTTLGLLEKLKWIERNLSSMLELRREIYLHEKKEK